MTDREKLLIKQKFGILIKDQDLSATKVINNASSMSFSNLPGYKQRLCKEIQELIISNIMHSISLTNLFITLEAYTENEEVKKAARTCYTLAIVCRIKKVKLLKEFSEKYENVSSLTVNELNILKGIRKKERNVKEALANMYPRINILLSLDKKTKLEEIIIGAKNVKNEMGKIVTPVNITLILIVVGLFLYTRI